MPGIKGVEYMGEDGVMVRTGGKLAAYKNKLRDPYFYKNIGRRGGLDRGNGGGFAANPALARIAGARGGRISRRRKVLKDDQPTL